MFSVAKIFCGLGGEARQGAAIHLERAVRVVPVVRGRQPARAGEMRRDHRPTYCRRNGIVKTSNADNWTSQKMPADRTPND